MGVGVKEARFEDLREQPFRAGLRERSGVYACREFQRIGESLPD